jgi:3-phosphoshikimate 1-carboxyvinyltransferase
MSLIKPLANPSAFSLTSAAPPSKAHTLRAIFMASLASGRSVIHHPLLAMDQKTALRCVEHLGVEYQMEEDKIILNGIGNDPRRIPQKIDCGESGLTARIMVGIASALTIPTVVTGSERMRTGRPIGDLVTSLQSIGFQLSYEADEGYLPVRITPSDTLFTKRFNQPRQIEVSTNLSSQFLTSLLIAAPLIKDGLIIQTMGRARSLSYVEITLAMLKDFGIHTDISEAGYHVYPGMYQSQEMTIEGDYSAAAFFGEAAAITGGYVCITNLKKDTKQGDIVFFRLLEQMGCRVRWEDDSVSVQGKPTKPLVVDMQDCPDIVMPLAVIMALTPGTHRIKNIGHLRIKESDRLSGIVENLKRCGGICEEEAEGIKIIGQHTLTGKVEFQVKNDHRLAMSFGLLGLILPGITVDQPQAVNKSFPSFWEVFSME